jgi:hypothetical protein
MMNRVYLEIGKSSFLKAMKMYSCKENEINSDRIEVNLLNITSFLKKYILKQNC